MLLRKYLLVTKFQVSKCGSHTVKIRRGVLYLKRTKFSKYRKGNVVGVANRTVHNLVLEDMAPKVVELVVQVKISDPSVKTSRVRVVSNSSGLVSDSTRTRPVT